MSYITAVSVCYCFLALNQTAFQVLWTVHYWSFAIPEQGLFIRSVSCSFVMESLGVCDILWKQCAWCVLLATAYWLFHNLKHVSLQESFLLCKLTWLDSTMCVCACVCVCVFLFSWENIKSVQFFCLFINFPVLKCFQACYLTG